MVKQMVRVGLVPKTGEPLYVIMLLTEGKEPRALELSESQAADVAHQIQRYLPEELLNVELGFSDKVGTLDG